MLLTSSKHPNEPCSYMYMSTGPLCHIVILCLVWSIAVSSVSSLIEGRTQKHKAAIF